MDKTREALELHVAYEAMPTDRGGANGPKGKAFAAFIKARDEALAALEEGAEPVAAFVEWAKSKGNFALGVVRVNGKFHHFADPDTDTAWLGFEAGFRRASPPDLTSLRERVAELEKANAAHKDMLAQAETDLEAAKRQVKATHRHKKRSSEYVLLGVGKMQATDWFDAYPTDDADTVDMREVAIYRSVEDGSLWARPREEFEDGRFEALSPEPSPGEAGEAQTADELDDLIRRHRESIVAWADARHPECAHIPHPDRAHLKATPEPGEATAYAERLARALHAKHYADNVEWKPLSGDLIGLLTQIDNMTAGLSRAAEPVATSSTMNYPVRVAEPYPCFTSPPMPSQEPGDDEVEAIIAWACDDVLPAYGIASEVGRNDPELATSARAALKAARTAR